MKLPSLMTAYLAWVLLQVIAVLHGFITGEHQSMMSMTVNKLEHLDPSVISEQMWSNFVIVTVCAFVSLIAVVGILVWQASKNKKWVIWTLTIFAIFQIYNYTESALRLDPVQLDFFGVPYWILDSIGSFIFLYIIFYIHRNIKNFGSDSKL